MTTLENKPGVCQIHNAPLERIGVAPGEFAYHCPACTQEAEQDGHDMPAIMSAVAQQMHLLEPFVARIADALLEAQAFLQEGVKFEGHLMLTIPGYDQPIPIQLRFEGSSDGVILN